MSWKPALLPRLIGAAAALGMAPGALAQDQMRAGSTAFCLYEIPADEPGKRRWVNLGIIQYIEATRTELKIYYGGGALGAGHEVKIPFASMEEAAAIMEKLRKTAAACR